MHKSRDTGGHEGSGPASVLQTVTAPAIWPSPTQPFIPGAITKENIREYEEAMKKQHEEKFRSTFSEIVRSSQDASTGGRKFDGGKLQYGLVPPHALEEMVKVLTFGAQKYEPDNWKRVPDGKRRYFDAAMRHLWAYKRGEEFDPETGIHHLAHALCCINFILDLDLDPTPENPKL